MDKSKLIQKIFMDCPICDKIHTVEKRTRMTKILMHGKAVHYKETYFLCRNSEDDENEFVTGKIVDENLMNARKVYDRLKGEENKK